VHVCKGSVKIVCIKIFTGEGNKTWGTVVSEVDENFTVGSALKNFTISSLDASSVSLKDRKEVSWGY